jgi:hypothetical protein
MITTLIFFSGLSGQEDKILSLKEQIIELQNQGTLGFANFLLCSQVNTFASYVPLPEPIIAKDGNFLLYYEPLNIFTKKQNGKYEIWYKQDMILMNAEEEVIAEWKNILEFYHEANKPVLDLFAQNTIDLEGLPAGKYKFKAVLKDQLRGATARQVIDFEIR